MTLQLVEHADPVASPVAAWDARWKLAGVLILAVTTALLRSWPLAAAALACAVLLAAVARVPAGVLLTRLGLLAAALSPFWLVLPFTSESVGVGLAIAAALTAKALTVAALTLTLTRSTPVPALAAAASRLRVPGVVVQLALMTYRYIFLIAAEFARLRAALRVRGFRQRLTRHSFRTVGRVTGALLVRSHDRAECVGRAMLARGFGGTFRTLDGPRTRVPDVAGFAMLSLIGLGLLAGDIWLRVRESV